MKNTKPIKGATGLTGSEIKLMMAQTYRKVMRDMNYPTSQQLAADVLLDELKLQVENEPCQPTN